MKKLWFCVCLMSFTAPLVSAHDKTPVRTDKPAVQATQKDAFKARRKEIKKLIKKYKKAPQAEKAAIKAQLTELVSRHVDGQITYMKNRIAAERANLDNWEAKIKQDEANLDQVKAQRVEDLLSGAAQQKQKEAKKAWKKQMRKLKK